MFARKPLPPWALTMCWPLRVFMIATPMSSAKSALFFQAVLVQSWLADHVPYGRGLARSSSYAGTNVQLVAQAPLVWPALTQWPAVQTVSLPSELTIAAEHWKD